MSDMLALSTAELEQMRKDLKMLMPAKCNILQATNAPDGAGGVSTTWGTATAGQDVACRLDPLRGREQMESYQMQAYQGYMLTLPHGTTITAQNRVEIGSNLYEVLSVDAEKLWSASVRCIVEAI